MCVCVCVQESRRERERERDLCYMHALRIVCNVCWHRKQERDFSTSVSYVTGKRYVDSVFLKKNKISLLLLFWFDFFFLQTFFFYCVTFWLICLNVQLIYAVLYYFDICFLKRDIFLWVYKTSGIITVQLTTLFFQLWISNSTTLILKYKYSKFVSSGGNSAQGIFHVSTVIYMCSKVSCQWSLTKVLWG